MFFNDFDNALKVTDVRIMHASTFEQMRAMSARPFNTLSFRIKSRRSFVSNGVHTVEMKQGDLLFMPAYTEFSRQAAYERLIVIHFESEKPFEKSFAVLHSDDPDSMRELFESAYHTWALKLPGYYQKTMATFYKILENLSVSENPTYLTYAYKSILPAIERMQRRFTQPDLQISELCRLVNLSDTQFRKHFVEVFGITPMKYLTKLRLERAAELLDDSPMSIEEVAHNSGFNDAKHFSTVFKQAYNISPLKYRKR